MKNILDPFKSAFIALIGRPNSGKSTLLNTILGEDLSIVTPMPQTTRRNIRGIYNRDNYQLIFIDTPGIHKGKHSFSESMYRQSMHILKDKGIDIMCYIVDLSRTYGKEEDAIASMVKTLNIPVYIIFNKTDLCATIDRTKKLFFNRCPELNSCKQVSICAISRSAKDIFLQAIEPDIPCGPKFYPDDTIYTDSNLRFLVSELIRKQIIDITSQEVPHASYVEILTYVESENSHTVEAVIHVETQGQKGIIIGKKGRVISKIKKRAQRELEHLTDIPAVISCHVAVTPKWRDNTHFLNDMGLDMR